MKIMKKILPASLACLLLVLQTGCKKELPSSSVPEVSPSSASASDSELKPEEGAALNFWCANGDLEFAKAVGKKFEEKYGVSVSAEELGIDLQEKMTLDGPGGSGADVFMVPHDKVLPCVSSGISPEMDASIVSSLSDRISSAALKTVTVDGKVYGIPVSIETDVLLYNKTLVTGEPAATFEQIQKEAASYNDAAANKFWYLAKVSDGSGIYPYLSAGGFTLFGKDGTDNDNPGFDTPEFVKGLTFLQSLHEIMPISSGDLTMANADFISNQFAEGKTAYIVGGPWNIQNFLDAKVDFGVTALPTYQGNAMRPFAYVQVAMTSAYSKYPKAAQLFAQYLTSDEAAGLLYSMRHKITSLADAAKVDGLSDDPYLSPILEQFQTSFPMPTASRISYYWTISANLGPAVFDGQLTPEDAAKKAVSDWDTLIQSE